MINGEDRMVYFVGRRQKAIASTTVSAQCGGDSYGGASSVA